MKRGLRRLEARTVIVTTKQPDDRSIRGVLVAVHADCLVLEQSVYLNEAQPAEAAKMGGQVVIPREHVAFLQTVAAVGQ